MLKFSAAPFGFCMAMAMYMPWIVTGVTELGSWNALEDLGSGSGSGGSDEPVSLYDARKIAKEAYIFFQPVIDQYRLKVEFESYGIPPNYIHLSTALPDPDTDQLTTPYKFPHQWNGIAFLDLRKEPIVVYNPPVDPHRMYSILLTDHFGHNFAYFGSRSTSNSEAYYMIAGPDWSGDVPPGISGIATAESNFVTLIIRMKVYSESPDDRKQAKRLLKSFYLTPLSVFNGKNATEALPYPNFTYKADQAERAGFFSYVNFFTAFARIHPDELDFYSVFERIGIVAGMPFPPENMSSTMVEAIEQGIWEGSKAIDSELDRPKGAHYQGWNYVVDPPLNGNREDMDQRYLARAASARSTFEWGNSIQEAVYMQTFTDSEGRPLDGKYKYTLKWTMEQIPKTNPLGFWAITIYDVNGHFAKSAFDRYAIGSQNDLQYGRDGSLTIYLQRRSPGEKKQSNWLPCPKGTFQLFLRIYWPADEMISEDYTARVPPGANIIHRPKRG